jgi:hypothetical protein
MRAVARRGAIGGRPAGGAGTPGCHGALKGGRWGAGFCLAGGPRPQGRGAGLAGKGRGARGKHAGQRAQARAAGVRLGSAASGRAGGRAGRPAVSSLGAQGGTSGSAYERHSGGRGHQPTGERRQGQSCGTRGRPGDSCSARGAGEGRLGSAPSTRAGWLQSEGMAGVLAGGLDCTVHAAWGKHAGKGAEGRPCPGPGGGARARARAARRRAPAPSAWGRSQVWGGRARGRRPRGRRRPARAQTRRRLLLSWVVGARKIGGGGGVEKTVLWCVERGPAAGF